jgi:hypothetical protein
LLFVRPDKVVIVDRLLAAAGRELPEVQWLLQLPGAPREDGGGLLASNGKSWLRCLAVLPGGAKPVVATTPVNTYRVSFTYPGKAEVVLVHVLEVGDGTTPGPPAPIAASRAGGDLEVAVEGQRFIFSGGPQHAVARSELP